MKKFFLLFVLMCLLVSAMAVSADSCTTCPTGKTCDPCTEECKFKVTYDGGNCLAVVPFDCEEHAYAECVEVMFEPVQYKNGLIFYGWDYDGDGVADFGYSNKTFRMPMHDVTMKAICIPQFYPAAPSGCHLGGCR